jgi:hypothetical protein
MNFLILFRVLLGTVQLPFNRKFTKYRMLLATLYSPTDEPVYFKIKLEWPLKVLKHSAGFNLDQLFCIYTSEKG